MHFDVFVKLFVKHTVIYLGVHVLISLEQVTVSVDDTIVIHGGGDKKLIEERCEEVVSSLFCIPQKICFLHQLLELYNLKHILFMSCQFVIQSDSRINLFQTA